MSKTHSSANPQGQIPSGLQARSAAQLDYSVATVLSAAALGTYDGQAAHALGGEEDSDDGEE